LILIVQNARQISLPAPTSKWPGEIVASVRADNKIPVAFHHTVPGPAFGVLHSLHSRGGARALSHGGSIGRNGTGVLRTKSANTGSQNYGGQGLSHGYLPEMPPKLPNKFGSIRFHSMNLPEEISARCASLQHGMIEVDRRVENPTRAAKA